MRNKLIISRQILCKALGIETQSEEWTYESYSFDVEDIDPSILSKDITLPDEVLTHTYQYCNESKEKEYTIFYITKLNEIESLYIGLLLNGSLIWSQEGEYNEEH